MKSNQMAQELAAALKTSGGAEELAVDLLTHVGTLSRPVVYDVGANLWLVVLPGWGTLDAPLDYVMLADPGA